MNEHTIELIEPIFDRQPGESMLWYRRFCRYRNQIGARSLLGCVNAEAAEKGRRKRSAKVPGSWSTAKKKWRWEERCTAWDVMKQQAEDKVWDDRFKEWREAVWEHSELLIKKAKPMLMMPTVKQVVTSAENGATITTIEAVDWYQFMPAMGMLKLGVLLGEKAIGNLNVAATLLTQAGFEIKDPNAVTILQADDAQESQQS